MSSLDLHPVVLFHRPNGPNSRSEDYLYQLVDDLSVVAAPAGYNEVGVAFVASKEAATVDGTALIPLYHRQMTYSPTGGVYNILVTDESWESPLWHTVATYWVLPIGSMKFGATTLHGWYSVEDEKVHYYSTDRHVPGGRTWRDVGVSTYARVCPIGTVLVVGGNSRTPLSTEASQFTNGNRTYVPGADLNVYPAVGNLVRFQRGDGSNWSFTSIEMQGPQSAQHWTFNGVGETGGPFRCVRWTDKEVFLVDDNAAAASHGQYKYTVHVTAPDGTPYSCDPKVINRAGTMTQPHTQAQSPGDMSTAG